MTDEQFQAGDTVRLRSGGPLMTVLETRMDPDGQKIWTAWFDGAGKESRASFPAAALEPGTGIPLPG